MATVNCCLGKITTRNSNFPAVTSEQSSGLRQYVGGTKLLHGHSLISTTGYIKVQWWLWTDARWKRITSVSRRTFACCLSSRRSYPSFFDFLNKPLFYTMSEVLLLFSKWTMLMCFKLKEKLYILSTTVNTPPAITFQIFEHILLVWVSPMLHLLSWFKF